MRHYGSERAGIAQRQRRLAAEPLCRDCRAKGSVVPSTVPDHIVPLSRGMGTSAVCVTSVTAVRLPQAAEDRCHGLACRGLRGPGGGGSKSFGFEADTASAQAL